MAHQSLQSIFPESFKELKSVIIESSLETHDRHADGQARIEPGGSRAYGNSMWVNLPQNICKAITENFPNASSLKPPHAAFPVPVVEGNIVYACRYNDSLRNDGFVDHKTLERLIADPVSSQLVLFDGDGQDSNKSIPSAADATTVSPEEQKKLILVVVRSTPDRLDSIMWGEVKKNDLGERYWGARETLYTREELQLAPVHSHAHTFSDGQPPKPFIKPQPAEQKPL